MLERRSFLAHTCAFGVAITLVACGEVATPQTTPNAAELIPEEEPSGNLSRDLPALPEMRSGRSQNHQEFTETGRLDRTVYFSDVTPGHVLNFYLDEMPALGWTETFRSDLDANGGELRYQNPGETANLYIKVTRRSSNQQGRHRSSTVLELSTDLP